MRFGLLATCLFGCSFAPSPGNGVAPDGNTPPDGMPPDGVELEDSPPDAPAVAPDCEVLATGLVACYDFEDLTAGKFLDKAGNHDANQAGFVATTRDEPADSNAVIVGVNASAKAAQSAEFSLANDFTITAWIMPVNPDIDENEGIVDHEGAWAMSIDRGMLKCWSNRTISNLFSVQAQISIANEWQLVACEVSGGEGCIHRIDKDGNHAKQCMAVLNAGTAGGNGISIGSFQDGSGNAQEQFNGAIDDLRIYSRGLSSTDLCTLAGHTVCTAQ